MSPCPIPLSAVAEPLRKHVDPASPAPLKLMAAKGLVPMAPKDMVTVLCCLAFDEDPKIGPAAQKSLSELPERITRGALGDDLHPLVLDQLAHVHEKNEAYLEIILTNQKTADETFAYLAERVTERLLNIIADNQVRILRFPPIAQALLQNPGIIKSTVDRLMDFAVRTGMDFRGLAAFEDAKKRILAAPTDPQESARIMQVVEASLPEEMLAEEPEAHSAEEAQELEKKKKNVLQRLYSMTPAQKVVLAQKGGNKTIRMALVKDPNKVVSSAAIKNPGITEGEVLAVANSRAVNDDVIRHICNNREWTRSYQVKLALVTNPKTPIAFSMRFLNAIRANDLKDLAGNKNIPNAICVAAAKLVDKRQAGR
jgi:hypothetical protein